MLAPRQATQVGFATGVILSLILHALAALLLVDGFKGHRPTQPVDSVEVELVAPPEISPPEPAPAEEEEAAVEEELPQEEELVEEEEETPAEPEPEIEPEPEPLPEEVPEAREQVRMMQPVEEFGEEDTAPASSEEGETQQAEASPEEVDPEELPIEEAVTEDAEAEEPETAETEVAEPQDVEEPEIQETEITALQPEEPQIEELLEETETVEPGETETPEEQSIEAESEAELGPQEPAPVSDVVDEDVVVPGPSEETEAEPAAEEIEIESGAEVPDETGESTGEGETVVAGIPRSKPPVPAWAARSARSARASARGGSLAGQLRPVTRILTGDVMVDSRTRTAMRGMPPGQRLIRLCTTELRAQLNASTPPFFPDLMPSLRPRSGTVLEPAGWVAFRSFGQWFNVAFRCQTDAGVRRVERFSLRVGSPVPRSQWRQRGFPL